MSKWKTYRITRPFKSQQQERLTDAYRKRIERSVPQGKMRYQGRGQRPS